MVGEQQGVELPRLGDSPLGAQMDDDPSKSSSRRRRRRSRKSSQGARRIWNAVGLLLLALVVASAPLATGGVHRMVIVPALLLTLVALVSVVAADLSAGIPLRISAAAAAPLLVFCAIPFLQSVPLPAFLVDRLDPVAADLKIPWLAGVFRPLSLDPPATWLAFGQAAAALATVIVTAHMMSGRSLRYLLLRAVVLSCLAAVVIGVGHRILGEERIYGVFKGSRGILNGPFINPNNTAEFLELGAFGAVALAFVKPSMINRVGWLAAAGFLAAGALGTLSRGAILGLGIACGLFIGLYRYTGLEEGERVGRRSWFVFALMAALIAVLALSLGASQIVAKFTQSSLTQDTRFRLWRDSFALLVAHPMGIGRGAFDRVYPTVRTLEVPISVRFSFTENEPLQLLLDTGWLGMAAIVFGLFLLARQIYRQRRGDRIELALVSGLVAVGVHNLVDFGLETLGVLLPASVLLGGILGRVKGWGELRLSRGRGLAVAGVAGGGLLLGAVAVALPASGDFDASVRATVTRAERRQELLRAEAAHPFDYYYVMLQSATEPLLRAGDLHSPRLRVLNQALTLCPRCPEVHTDVGRSLWALGRRRQALAEWRVALQSRPVLFEPLTEEVWQQGAKPEEMALLAGDNPELLIRIADLLLRKSERAGARKVLDSASVGFPASKNLLALRADLDLGDGRIGEATEDLNRLDAIAVGDPRGALLRADLALRTKDIAGALAILDKGIAATPDDVPLHERRVQLIMTTEKWSRAEAALEGWESALFHAGRPTTAVHTARAQLAAQLGDSKAAISEYRAAINHGGGEARLWMDLAQYFETQGRYSDAQLAWREAQHKAPNEPTIAAAITRLRERQADAESIDRSRFLLGR
jgi:tetratricopeptide (TPR) repeat protein